MTPKKYEKLLDQLAQAETDLTRAVNRWQKLRAQVKRAAKTLDRDFVARASADIPGTIDLRALTDEAHGHDARSRAKKN